MGLQSYKYHKSIFKWCKINTVLKCVRRKHRRKWRRLHAIASNGKPNCRHRISQRPSTMEVPWRTYGAFHGRPQTYTMRADQPSWHMELIWKSCVCSKLLVLEGYWQVFLVQIMLIDGWKAIPTPVFVLDLVIVLLKAQNFDFEPIHGFSIFISCIQKTRSQPLQQPRVHRADLMPSCCQSLV